MTEKGLSEIANIPLVAEEIGKKLKEQGGELKGFYKTMGVIDYVAIIEAPNDKIALAAVMAFALTGYFNGTTLKAFTLTLHKYLVQKRFARAISGHQETIAHFQDLTVCSIRFSP